MENSNIFFVIDSDFFALKVNTDMIVHMFAMIQ